MRLFPLKYIPKPPSKSIFILFKIVDDAVGETICGDSSMKPHYIIVRAYSSTAECVCHRSKLKYTLPDGKTGVKDRKAGEVTWNEPVTHAVENIGTTDQHVIVIKLKK